MTKQIVSSWGRLSRTEQEVVELSDRSSAGRQILNGLPGLPQGMARSYGDVCLNDGGTLWRTTALDHYVAFEEDVGRLVCESGVLLRDILRMAIPRGWILPVTPGTQLITVGGAIANDVHGKNHHVLGSFGDHVRRIHLLRTDGTEIVCGPNLNKGMFRATVGGLGLTGLITLVELQLRRVAGPWLDTETLAYENLSRFFELADASEQGWEHTVSWIDCVSGGGGRGIFMRGNHVDPGGVAGPEPLERTRTVPFEPPMSMVNRASLTAFNALYYNVKRATAGRRITHYVPFFYPLDNLLEWNRVYGPRGFYQYQSVVPRAAGAEAVKAMLDVISKSGSGSFLAVLKTFGQRNPVGMLSFPCPGVTLALDFPNRGERTHRVFASLDAIVREAGGKLYMAKDARMPRDLFEQSYPAHAEFRAYRDPGISSGMSRRLFGD
jgi:FAD/FMN-containing dehydrogenase